MAVVVLCSVSGAPGTTTTALGLALQWPRRVLLADCDRDAPQAIVGGYFGGHTDGRGMMSVLQALRRHAPIRETLLDHARRLDAAGTRLVLTGFTHPSASTIFTGWSALGEEFSALADRGWDVLVDAGRVGPRGLPAEVLAHTDLLLVATGSGLRSLVALDAHLPTVVEQAAQASAACATGLVVIGPDRPYSVAEIAAQFRQPVHLQLPWAPDDAAVLSDAEEPPRRFERGSYLAALVRGAHDLTQLLGAQDDRRGHPGPLHAATPSRAVPA